MDARAHSRGPRILGQSMGCWVFNGSDGSLNSPPLSLQTSFWTPSFSYAEEVVSIVLDDVLPNTARIFLVAEREGGGGGRGGGGKGEGGEEEEEGGRKERKKERRKRWKAENFGLFFML